MKKRVLIVAVSMLVFLAISFSIPAQAESASIPCYVTGDVVREREGPSTDYAIVAKHKYGEIVEVAQMLGDWWQLTNGNYMFAEYLLPTDEAEFFLNPQTYYVIGDGVRERTGPSTNYDIVTKHNMGTALNVVGEKNGWYRLANGNFICGDYVVKSWDEALATLNERYGGDFILVWISAQRVECYADDMQIVAADCVTGNTSTSPTPTGVYQVYYKNHDFDMNGNPNNHVKYFTCFNGGIGIHDAPWRHGEFGGTIYRGNGSHGCVNTTEEAAQIIYENSKIGTYVIVLP